MEQILINKFLGIWPCSWPTTQNPGDPGHVQNNAGNQNNNIPVGVPTGAVQGQPQGQELAEMMTMLDQSGPTAFEDITLTMFNTQFE